MQRHAGGLRRHLETHAWVASDGFPEGYEDSLEDRVLALDRTLGVGYLGPRKDADAAGNGSAGNSTIRRATAPAGPSDYDEYG